jgi:hypothetical protein
MKKNILLSWFFVLFLFPPLLSATPRFTMIHNFGQLYLSKKATSTLLVPGVGALFGSGVGCRLSNHWQAGAQLDVQYYHDKFMWIAGDIGLQAEENHVWEHTPYVFLRYDALKKGRGAFYLSFKVGASHTVSEVRLEANPSYVQNHETWGPWLSPELGLSYSIPRTNMTISLALGHEYRIAYYDGLYGNQHNFYSKQGLEINL